MARRDHLLCPACGSRRLLEAFGIDDAGRYDSVYVPAPAYETAYSIQEIGGRGRCTWEHQNIPLEHARALRARLKAVLDQLDQEINAASSEGPPNGA